MPVAGKSLRDTAASVYSDNPFEDYLLQNRHEILKRLGFCAEFGYPALEDVDSSELEVLRQIDGALLLAADLAINGLAKTRDLKKTVEDIVDCPEKALRSDIHADVQWLLAQAYQRKQERPGTYAQDVLLANAPQKPSPGQIAAAAQRALRLLGSTTKRGRPLNAANAILGDRLGALFGEFNQEGIVRANLPIMRGKKVGLKESGRFASFLEAVLPPLADYLRRFRCPPVTIKSIIDHAQQFPRPHENRDWFSPLSRSFKARVAKPRIVTR